MLEELKKSEEESGHTEEISWFNKMGTERLLVLVLIHFIPLVSFFTPFKHRSDTSDITTIYYEKENCVYIQCFSLILTTFLDQLNVNYLYSVTKTY